MTQLQATAGGITAQITPNRPSWADMYRYYPAENIPSSSFYPMVSARYAQLAKENPGDWENTCAARMSYALNRSGIKLKKALSTGGTIVGSDGYNYWIRVNDLKQFLRNSFKKPDIEFSPKKTQQLFGKDADERINGVKNNVLNKISGMKGIIVFDVTGWSNASGHFTLWDGKNLVYVGPGTHNDPNSSEYYFWFMREDISFSNSTGFLTKVKAQTTHISFWELK